MQEKGEYSAVTGECSPYSPFYCSTLLYFTFFFTFLSKKESVLQQKREYSVVKEEYSGAKKRIFCNKKENVLQKKETIL